MPWSDDLAHLTAAGYDESQISTYKQEQADKLRAGGFDDKAINSYFGLQEADMSLAKSMIEKNVAAYKPEEAATFEDQVAAGFQISNIGQLLKFSKGESVQPSKVLPQDAGTKATVTAGLSQMASDIPSMAGGFMVGQEVGGVIGAGVGMLAAPVVGPLGPLGGFAMGKAIGGAAGAFAAPTMIRSLLMNFYEKGQIKDTRDFMSRLGSTFLETAKSGTVGVATEAIGGQVGATMVKAGAKTLVASTAKLAAEVGTMTSVSAALEGEMPKYQDFINGAIMVGAFHGAVKTVDMSAATVSKMRKIYEATGTKPEQVVLDSQADPILKQELLSNSQEIPSAYKDQIDPKYEAIKSEMSDQQTLYHGTNTKFEKLDFERGGGMVHFGETESVANKYALTINGGGGRKNLPFDETKIIDTSKPESDGPYLFKDGVWTQEKTGKTITKEELQKDLNDGGSYSIEPLDPQIIKQTVDRSKILNTYNKEGLQKIVDTIVPKDKYQERLVNEARKEIAQEPGAAGFGNQFWTMTKSAKGEQINASLKDFSKQLSDAGYEGIRYRDDSNPSVAIFDPKFKEAKSSKIGETPANVQAAVEHIQSRFGEKVEPKTDLKTAVTEFISEVPSKYVDRFSPVKDVSEGAYNKLRMLNASSGKAWNYIFDGARDFQSGEKVGKSLEQITKEVGNREDNANFKAYLVAKRVVEDLSPRNIDQKIDFEKAKTAVDHFEKTTDFKRLGQEYTKYNDGLLQYGADAGLYSQKNIDAIKELSKNYVSFKKILDPESTTTKGKGSAKIHTIGSSDKLIQDPYLSAADKTATIIRLAERNRALTEFKDAAVAKGLVERVPAPKIEAKATVEELNAFLRKEGIDHEVDQTAALSLWRAGNIKDEPGQFSVMIDGKREVYKFTEDASQLLETSITTLTENPLIQNSVMEALRGLTQFKKGSITIAPIFKLNNLFKDWTTFTVKTGEPAGPGEVLAAAMSIAKKDAQYIDFMQSGGSNAGFINPEIIANRLNQIGGLKLDKTGKYVVDNSIIGKTWNVISEAKEFNAVLSEVSDNTMRLIQYQRSLKSGMSKEQSAMAARDVTLDFDKRGQSAALANYTAITSFARVAINGIDNTIGTLKNNPQAFANGVKYITIPSVLLWAANKTDKRMDDIPEWEKLVFWHIPTHKWVPVNEDNILKFNGIVNSEHYQHLIRQTSDGKYEMDEGIIFRIPKNELFGTMFGTLPQLALDQVYDRLISEGKPQDAKKMVDNVLGLVKPNIMPDFAVPLVEQFANKNFFTGQKIIPSTLEQASPEHQYNEYTTDAARAAGSIIGYLPFVGKNGLDDKTISSPMIVENYVRSWAGNNGMYALQALSKLIPDSVYQSKEYKSAIEKPSTTVYDIPEVKRLITRYPQLNSQPITDFEALYEKYQQSIADYRQANKELNIESAVGIKAEALRKYGEIAGMHSAMQSAHTAVKMIKLSNMTGDQKQQMIEAAYFQMNEIAKKGLEAARQNEDLIKQLGEGN